MRAGMKPNALPLTNVQRGSLPIGQHIYSTLSWRPSPAWTRPWAICAFGPAQASVLSLAEPASAWWLAVVSPVARLERT